MPSDRADSVRIMHGTDKKSEIKFSEKRSNIKELPEPDIIFDLAATNRTYWITALSKATLKVGLPYRSILNRLLYDVGVFRSDFSSEIEAMLDILRILGNNPEGQLNFAYPNNKEHKNTTAPFIIYFNGASQESKMYRIAEQAELLAKAAQTLPDYQHIFLESLNSKEKGDSLRELERYNSFFSEPSLDLKKSLNCWLKLA